MDISLPFFISLQKSSEITCGGQGQFKGPNDFSSRFFYRDIHCQYRQNLPRTTEEGLSKLLA